MSSIQSKALLVTFSAGIGSSFRVTDKDATREVCKNKKAQSGRAEVKKRLLPDDALKPLKDAIQAARDFHDEMTLPWSKAGDILRITNFEKYTAGMRQHKAKVEAAKDDFLALWQQYCEAAPAQLGELYRAADYPPVDKVAKGITFETKFLPLPSGQDFRVDMAEEEVSELRTQVDAQIRATIFTPFIEPLANMVKRLREPEGVFRNTLVTNLQRLISLVPPGDPAVDQLTAEMAQVVKYDPETLRVDKGARAETAARANDILAKMAGYLPSDSVPALAPLELPPLPPTLPDLELPAPTPALQPPNVIPLPVAPAPVPAPAPAPAPATRPTVPAWRRVMRSATSATATLL